MTRMILNGITYYEGDPDIGVDEARYAENLRILHRRIRELGACILDLEKRNLSLLEVIEMKNGTIANLERKLRNKQQKDPSPDYRISGSRKKIIEAYEEYISNLEEES